VGRRTAAQEKERRDEVLSFFFTNIRHHIDFDKKYFNRSMKGHNPVNSTIGFALSFAVALAATNYDVASVHFTVRL
jgi:hypothetical protein